MKSQLNSLKAKNQKKKSVEPQKVEPKPKEEPPTEEKSKPLERKVTQGSALAKYQKALVAHGGSLDLLESESAPDAAKEDASKKKPAFSVAKESCQICGKTVYQTEKARIQDAILHEKCFNCKHCKLKLKLTNYISWEGDFYCKPHFKELFSNAGFKSSKGNEGESTEAEVKEPTETQPLPKKEKPKEEEQKKIENVQPKKVSQGSATKETTNEPTKPTQEPPKKEPVSEATIEAKPQPKKEEKSEEVEEKKKTSAFSMKRETCYICSKTVYATEKVAIKEYVFHNGCFKCKHCGLKLKLTNYVLWEGTFYCKPHFTQLGFAKKKPSDIRKEEEEASSREKSTDSKNTQEEPTLTQKQEEKKLETNEEEKEESKQDTANTEESPPKKEPAKAEEQKEQEPTKAEQPKQEDSLQAKSMAFYKNLEGNKEESTKPIAAKGGASAKKFTVARDICHTCGKTVYAAEKLQIKDTIFHKLCFKCKHCGCALKLTNYSPWEGQFYCRPHFNELFRDVGFSENKSQVKQQQSSEPASSEGEPAKPTRKKKRRPRSKSGSAKQTGTAPKSLAVKWRSKGNEKSANFEISETTTFADILSKSGANSANFVMKTTEDGDDIEPTQIVQQFFSGNDSPVCWVAKKE